MAILNKRTIGGSGTNNRATGSPAAPVAWIGYVGPAEVVTGPLKRLDIVLRQFMVVTMGCRGAPQNTVPNLNRFPSDRRVRTLGLPAEEGDSLVAEFL